MSNIANYTIEQLFEGQTAFFEITITKSLIDAFVELSGDASPLHVNSEFAFERGFVDRVAHGAIFCCLASRLIGVHLPGRNCILLGMNFKFHLPSYINDSFRVKGTIAHISIAANAADILIDITNIKSGLIHARGKLTVSFTNINLIDIHSSSTHIPI